MEIIRGNDYTIPVTVTNSDGSPYNLTGCTLYFTVKKKGDINTSDDTNAIVQKIVTTHTTPLSGISSIVLSSTETNIAQGEYYYDIQIKNASDKKSSIKKQTFSVVQDVTKT